MGILDFYCYIYMYSIHHGLGLLTGAMSREIIDWFG